MSKEIPLERRKELVNWAMEKVLQRPPPPSNEEVRMQALEYLEARPYDGHPCELSPELRAKLGLGDR